MDEWTLHRAAEAVGGEVRGGSGDISVTHWTYDSRLPAAPDGNCFLCLPGARRSGVDYVPELLARGVRLFCVSAQDFGRLSPKHAARGTFWIVDEVLGSVQALAAKHRDGLRGEVVAITGSNGKTIVKEWLYRLLQAAGLPTYRSPASHNSQLGVALSVLHDRDPATRIHVFEAGISRAGEMAALRGMIHPTLGILTNIGAAHDDGFDHRADKVREKLSLFTDAEGLIYDFDELLDTPGPSPLYTEGLLDGTTLYGWCGEEADDEPADGLHTLLYTHGLVIVIAPSGQATGHPLQFPCPFPDAASRQNLGHALLAALLIGRRAGVLTDATVGAFRARLAEAIPTLSGLDMRLQAYAGPRGGRVIDDTYSADRDGLRAAAEFFSQQRLPGGPTRWILGRLQDGDRSARETTAFVRALAERHHVDEVWTVGAGWVADGIGEDLRHRHFDTPRDVLTALSTPPPMQTVLVKGPRAERFDQIARALRERAHGLQLEISLPALAHNVAAYRRHLRPTTKICVMVKAEAYGAGAAEVAAFFEQRGVDYLAVATVDEGVDIRRAGVSLPVIVADAAPDDRERLVTYALEPEVTSLDALRAYRPGGDAPPLRLHLKLDTGMHRLGIDATRADASELDALAEELNRGGYVVISVFSHLSAADRPDADDFTRLQHARLLAGVARVEAALGYRPLVHLLNSVGAWRLPELQHDMVRLGLGVYGLGLEAFAPGALEPAHRWVGQLVQVREVAAGEVVGYGLGGRADHARRIGVVNVGYADGLRRSVSDGGYDLLVDGRRAPIVGSVCMDFTMVDLANAPHAVVGDEVVVFGPERPVHVLAEAYGTIAYEVFTGIGSRVRRVFYR